MMSFRRCGVRLVWAASKDAHPNVGDLYVEIQKNAGQTAAPTLLYLTTRPVRQNGYLTR